MAKMNINFLLTTDKGSTGKTSGGQSLHNEAPRSETFAPSLDHTSLRLSHFSGEFSSHSPRQPRPSHSFSPRSLMQESHSGSCETRQNRFSNRHLFSTSRLQKKNGTFPGSHSARRSSSCSGKPQVCPLCERKFYKLEQLRRHERIVHLNLRPFECKTCDLSFGTKQNMQVHLTTQKHQHRVKMLKTRRKPRDITFRVP